jgi:hypothetical protein
LIELFDLLVGLLTFAVDEHPVLQCIFALLLTGLIHVRKDDWSGLRFSLAEQEHITELKAWLARYRGRL